MLWLFSVIVLVIESNLLDVSVESLAQQMYFKNVNQASLLFTADGARLLFSLFFLFSFPLSEIMDFD